MWIAASIAAGILLAVFLVVLALVVVSIHVEDNRASITGRAPGATTAGARRLLGVRVDHSTCRARPQDACPLCRHLLQKEGGLRKEGGADAPDPPGFPKPYPDEITGG
ncbi:hypothetical protein [Planomonospora venezuelensis]|uniref:Uncharacterized protein n=2 Tax=Planomonospora venezuelensis TaxID=1999 RepID=A0A841CZQ1_PLAVE|nr:hypothetical protein [Planomonospora venezuelensis]MBB5962759.1 hypothetical protein [Planomonospora venezuelensis]GIM99445.1 hypothetical protein Pve01_11040 [Planomonospora venezuelensis]